MLHGVVLELFSMRMGFLYAAYISFTYSMSGYIFSGHLNAESRFYFLYFATCLLFVDFVHYLFHRVRHSVSLLWMAHSVHHSDDKFNLSTFTRASWVESIYANTPTVIGILAGFDPIMVLVVSQINFFYQFLCHSSYVKLPLWCDLLLMTPRNHQIHHDQEVRHQNSNYGGILSIWDRMCGTYIAEIDTFKPGIKGYHQDNFIKMETDPILDYIKSFQRIG